MTKETIQNFSGGIVNDPRDTSTGVARVVTNFDINTSPNRLIPYRSSEDGNSNSANDLMQNWCVALRTGSTYSLYGYGRQTAANKVRIFYKNLTTGGANDLDDNGWTETANNTATSPSTPLYNLFVYYRKTGYIYGAHGGQYIWRYDPTGSGAFADSHLDLTSITNVAQGIVHSKDDCLYIPYDNKIAKNDNGTWTNAAITIPSHYYITSICEFNNYIAIAAAPLDGITNSRVYIWDRSTTLTTVAENIDWGSGVVKILEEISGYLVGISLVQGTNFNERLAFRYYIGAGAVSFGEYLGATASNLLQMKQKLNNRIYFTMSLSLNGAVRDGVWSFGKNPNGQGFNLIHERTPSNDTSILGGPMRGFFYVGDYLFQAFVDASSVHIVSKTDDTALYSATSVFESVINPNMKLENRLKLKQLTSISVGYKTQSAVSGQVVVKYKVDGGSYITAFTATTTGVNVFEAQDAVGVPFTKGREYEFRIESTLGAEIISFNYGYEVVPTLA